MRNDGAHDPSQENIAIAVPHKLFNKINMLYEYGGSVGPPWRVVSAANRQILPGENYVDDPPSGINFIATPFMQ